MPWSPLCDAFPDVDAAFIGGGYPELHAPALQANAAGRGGLRDAIAAGMPAYAECGGMMYLGRSLETDAATHAMAGAIDAVSTMSPKRSALRYVEATAQRNGPLFEARDVVRGHEFHYSRARFGADSPAYAIEGAPEGFASPSVHASYVHLHLGGLPRAAERFVARAAAFGGRA